jgi:hypothetical protein
MVICYTFLGTLRIVVTIAYVVVVVVVEGLFSVLHCLTLHLQACCATLWR